ncbi:unnamed protein product [Amoebophrya sp. A25]|nr:unnamed protein product [Amoebophrya sp. A25]|eukprot:GSA25T00015313001.1
MQFLSVLPPHRFLPVLRLSLECVALLQAVSGGRLAAPHERPLSISATASVDRLQNRRRHDVANGRADAFCLPTVERLATACASALAPVAASLRYGCSDGHPQRDLATDYSTGQPAETNAGEDTPTTRGEQRAHRRMCGSWFTRGKRKSRGTIPARALDAPIETKAPHRGQPSHPLAARVLARFGWAELADEIALADRDLGLLRRTKTYPFAAASLIARLRVLDVRSSFVLRNALLADPEVGGFSESVLTERGRPARDLRTAVFEGEFSVTEQQRVLNTIAERATETCYDLDLCASAPRLRQSSSLASTLSGALHQAAEKLTRSKQSLVSKVSAEPDGTRGYTSKGQAPEESSAALDSTAGKPTKSAAGIGSSRSMESAVTIQKRYDLRERPSSSTSLLRRWRANPAQSGFPSDWPKQHLPRYYLPKYATLSDVDDTLLCSNGEARGVAGTDASLNPTRDHGDKLSHGAVYPGLALVYAFLNVNTAIHSALRVGSAHPNKGFADLVPASVRVSNAPEYVEAARWYPGLLTARPGEARSLGGLVNLRTGSRLAFNKLVSRKYPPVRVFHEAKDGMGPVLILPGERRLLRGLASNARSLHAYAKSATEPSPRTVSAVGNRKVETFRQYLQLLPELQGRVVFLGDDGQADLDAAEQLLAEAAGMGDDLSDRKGTQPAVQFVCIKRVWRKINGPKHLVSPSYVAEKHRDGFIGDEDPGSDDGVTSNVAARSSPRVDVDRRKNIGFQDHALASSDPQALSLQAQGWSPRPASRDSNSLDPALLREVSPSDAVDMLAESAPPPAGRYFERSPQARAQQLNSKFPPVSHQEAKQSNARTSTTEVGAGAGARTKDPATRSSSSIGVDGGDVVSRNYAVGNRDLPSSSLPLRHLRFFYFDHYAPVATSNPEYALYDSEFIAGGNVPYWTGDAPYRETVEHLDGALYLVEERGGEDEEATAGEAGGTLSSALPTLLSQLLVTGWIPGGVRSQTRDGRSIWSWTLAGSRVPSASSSAHSTTTTTQKTPPPVGAASAEPELLRFEYTVTQVTATRFVVEHPHRCLDEDANSNDIRHPPQLVDEDNDVEETWQRAFAHSLPTTGADCDVTLRPSCWRQSLHSAKGQKGIRHSIRTLSAAAG